MTQIITTSSITVDTNIAATTADEFIYIAEGITRAATSSSGVISGGFDGTRVYVLGSVVGVYAIFLQNATGSVGDYDITIGATGSVIGMGFGIVLEDDNNTVTNQGQITGYDRAIYSFGAEFQLTNTGTITSTNASAVYSQGSGSDIVNYGLIQALGTAYNAIDFSFSDAGAAVTLTNFGTVSAASGIAVEGDSDGVDKIYNFSIINGDVRLNGGNDFFRNGGQVLGDIDLGQSNDLFNGGGGTVEGNIIGSGGNDTISGGISDNALFGGSGNDILKGGIGEDTITGGNDADLITGGADADVFDFNIASETGTTAGTRDRITDFTHLTDDIDLSTIDANGAAAGNTAFSFIATKGAAFTGAPGQLRWFWADLVGTAGDKTIVAGDINGNGIADFQIELTGLKTLTAADFFL